MEGHAARSLDDLTVIVPVRNAAHLIEECLESIAASRPAEIVVVDGNSTDGTVEIARRYTDRIVSDHGRGVAAARMLGAETARTRWVALIDADVVLHEGALADLLDEFRDAGYQALQAGLWSVSGPGYWGQALVDHHRTGRSRGWFGVVCTIFEREFLLGHALDQGFASGEDIELRWRLERKGAKIGVSTRTVVSHRFHDTFEFAKDQFLMDGRGHGGMLATQSLRGAWLLALPLAAGSRGIALSVARRRPKWIPYYGAFVVWNYKGMLEELLKRARGRRLRLGDGGRSEAT